MPRPAPPPTPRAAEYWRSGADGVLRIARCAPCGTYIHPPRPLCPQCHSADVAFAPVSGKGTVYSFTVNRYQWTPALEPPYVLAEVDLAEQPGLRLLTAVVGCPVDAVRIGMPVTVAFERAVAFAPAGESEPTGESERAGGEPDSAWIPVFRP